MELIVTEKDNAARRIAAILSGESAEVERENGVNVYRWGGTRCIGLSGHVVAVDFPEEYADWRDVEPVELIDAGIVKTETKPDIVRALRSLARRADRVTIATDYDREGELIGKEAYELVREADESVPLQRVRFSSITEREVTEAFDNPDELDFDLAAAGEARQIVDLVWGAALTRFLSLSARQLGDDFISVGRVQSPTLKLIVDREREIQAFEPEDYWELFADLRTADGQSFEAQYFYRDEDGNEAERVWDETAAEAAYETLSGAGTGTVARVDRRTRTDEPPAPFNTTQFIRAAGSLGYSAQRAMSIAEDLYTAGYVTYPRTDNTVYPDDLDPEALLESLAAHPSLGEDAEKLLGGEITPTRGDEQTTDHPPIHPTGELPSASDLSDDERAVYELVVRRFYATVADPAEWEHLKVVVEVGDRSLKANGKRLLDPGYLDVYPYASSSENLLPAVETGESLTVEDLRLEDKQTQPPRRYGQSRLVETMEELGLGTKSTRHNTLEKLYDRGYVEDDPPRPTQLAMAVVEAAEEYADHVVSVEMTRQLEADMTRIANGEATLEEVTAESREMLERVFEELTDSREAIGEFLQESLKADKTLGPCPDCGDDLLVRRSRRGNYFVGCDGYPDCEYTLPLPNTGKPLVLDAECEDHGLRHVKMLAGRSTFVHGCPQCRAEAAGEGPIIGSCPDCGRDHGGELAIKTLQSGSRLVGCTRYPDCEYSLPLPRRGEIEITDDRCEEHGLPELVVHSGDDPWELGCPICNYEEYRARTGEGEEGSDADADGGAGEPDDAGGGATAGTRTNGAGVAGNGDLESLSGLGPTLAERLAAAGVETVGDLAAADPEALAGRVDGVSAERLREWQSQLRAEA